MNAFTEAAIANAWLKVAFGRAVVASSVFLGSR